MNSKAIIIFFAGLIVSGSGILSAQKVYVSPNGNDTYPGTIEKPVATLNGARDRVREYRKSNKAEGPIEVIALEGEYFLFQPLNLSVADGGGESSPLVFKAEEGKKVIFSGGTEISGFEKVTEKLWRAFIPQVAYYDSYFEQLYVNGRRAVRAKSPNNGFFRVKKVDETVLEKGEGRAPELAVQKIEIDSSDASVFSSFSREDYQDALIIFYHNWDNTRKRITGFSKQSSSFYYNGRGYETMESDQQ